MKRRTFLHSSILATTGVISAPLIATSKDKKKDTDPVLTVAHITDVHIRPEENVPQRAIKCLEEIKKHKIDFFLNGGDSIHDASYDDVKKERVLEQWAVWDDFRDNIKDYEVYSCIGNHDPWWQAPSKSHEMYGIPYAVKRLGIPNRYYSFTKNGWHFIILDGNNKGISLDKEQMDWLKNELASLSADTPVLLMSHYPILGVTPSLVGGQHSDFKELKELFYKHKTKVKVCLSGHQHLVDRAWYNGVEYFCNGALSGFWWGDGDESSEGKGYYQETPPGFAILKLFEDGTVQNQYIPHLF